MLAGVLPFKGDSLKQVFEAIKTVKLDFQAGIWEHVSKPARDLLERMLTRDVSARITADEVLTHPWILFHTERTLTLRTLSIKSKIKNQPGYQQPPVSKVTRDLNEKIRDSSCADENSSGDSSSGSSRAQKDVCHFVDALAAAISRVTISEPKRSRLREPTRSIWGHCSSNVTY